MSWIIYSLIAPIFWSFSNYIDKYSLEKNVTNIFDFLFFSSIFGWLFLPILVLIFGLPEFNTFSLVPITLGVVLVYSYGFYGKALEVGETSRIVILFKLIPVLTLALGFVFLQQTLTLNQFFAFLLVLAGAIFVSIEKSESGFKLYNGTFWIVGAICIWSVMFLVSDWTMTKISFEEFIVFDTLGTSIAGPLMLLIPSVRRKIFEGWFNSTKQKFGWFFANNITDLLGQMAMKKSLSLAPAAGLVTVAIQIQSIYVIALGVLLTLVFPQHFSEDISVRTILGKLVGASIMFCGIYLLFINS
jgi:bacterial/archaeal transporter family protein